jgi:GNAT superfamily N-acetyltransferase
MTENCVLDTTASDAPILAGQVSIVPVSQTSRADLTAIFAGEARAAADSGLVAYVDRVPAGWVALQPGSAGVWAMTCLAVRSGYRGRGLTYHLAKATLGFARERGACAVEAVTTLSEPGCGSTWGEPHVCARQVFADAGFAEFSHPSTRRAVMRADLRHAPA